ncbi:enoyl-CoA hydratase/isomerase family protein [Candidatus Puniceispirillum sp.]|nr:enoyl-CoA hydratase/isomerase family protein [Candidatus Puniceispirillum sp.]
MPQDNNQNTPSDVKGYNVSSHVYHDIVGVCGVVTLDRPHALNALNNDMVWSLYEIFTRWKNDPVVGHVVLSSSSSRAFCAGGDIRQVRDSILAGDSHVAEQFFQGEYLADLAIAEFNKPIIALCDGLVMGGGAGLAQHSSHIIMAETTRFAMPESKIGLFPDVGASLFLGRCPLPVARLLGMTGFMIDGASCIMLGLASAMVPSQNIRILKQSLMRCDTDEIDKLITSYQTDPGLPSLSQHMPSISDIFAGEKTPEDMQERAQDLLCLQPNDTFVQQIVTAFAEGCPFSVKLFWRLLQVAENFTTADAAISLDYHLALKMIRRPDFVEGVRALLVDKDKAPKWSPNRLDLVDNDFLEEVFNQDDLLPLR